MNWRHFLPTEVYFGKGILLEKGCKLKELGKRVLIITGKSSSKNGSLRDLKDVLEDLKADYEIYSDVKENPSFNDLRDARRRFEGFQPDFIIGLGGGSPMDFAKALSVLLKNPNLNVSEIYETDKHSSMYPVVEIPTTAGTGSEVTQYSVITDDDGNKKSFGADHTFPTLSFVDPSYTLTMPPDLTVSTGVDALCHAVEGYLSKRANPIVMTLAENVVLRIKKYLPMAKDNPKDEEARTQMMLASTMAGIVISQSGTTINHAFGYPVTTFKGVRHGQASGLFLVETVRVMSKAIGEKVEKILKPFGGLEGLDEFLRDLGVYDLKIHISPEELEKWSLRTSKAKHLKATEGDFSLETVKSIYEKVATKIG